MTVKVVASATGTGSPYTGSSSPLPTWPLLFWPQHSSVPPVRRAQVVKSRPAIAMASLGALLLTVLLGSLIAARMTRDLDELVAGTQAASRGDLVELKDSKERLVLADRVAAWQEIARRLAHEIKNPLTPIQMSVETLRKSWTVKQPLVRRDQLVAIAA
jgi:signal transduction histidine kinase